MPLAGPCLDHKTLHESDIACAIIFVAQHMAAPRTSTRFRRGDQAHGKPGTAVPHASSEVAALHFSPAQLTQPGGMVIGLPQVRDREPTTRPQHANRFVESLAPASGCRNV